MQEPIVRLRVICQSWKVMFQAEYSSGSPLRMLVDLRASVDQALGRGKAIEPGKAKAEPKPAPAAKNVPRSASASKAGPVTPKAAAAAAGASQLSGKAAIAPASTAKRNAKPALVSSNAPEFEISSTPGWEPDPESEAGKKN